MKSKKQTKKKSNKNTMECQQYKCSFRKNGCRPCEDCGAEPNFVNENCQRCFDCEYKEGKLRWSDGSEEKEDNKILIEVKQ